MLPGSRPAITMTSPDTKKDLDPQGTLAHRRALELAAMPILAQAVGTKAPGRAAELGTYMQEAIDALLGQPGPPALPTPFAMSMGTYGQGGQKRFSVTAEYLTEGEANALLSMLAAAPDRRTVPPMPDLHDTLHGDGSAGCAADGAAQKEVDQTRSRAEFEHWAGIDFPMQRGFGLQNDYEVPEVRLMWSAWKEARS